MYFEVLQPCCFALFEPLRHACTDMLTGWHDMHVAVSETILEPEHCGTAFVVLPALRVVSCSCKQLLSL
jgi:hypothetical protein